MSATTVCKIFWPETLLKSDVKSGYLVGWNIRGFIVCVSTVVTDRKLHELDEFLDNLVKKEDDPAIRNINRHTKGQPIVLGQLVTSDTRADMAALDSELLDRKRNTSNIWMNVQLNDASKRVPSVQSIYCCGYKYNQQSLSVEFIFFRPPDIYYLQYFSLDRLDLDVSVDELVHKDKDGRRAAPVNKEIMEKIHLHTRFSSTSRKSFVYELETVLHQINCICDLNRKIHTTLYMDSIAFFRRMLATYVMKPLSPLLLVIGWLIALFLMLVRLVAEGLLTALNLKLKPSHFWNGLSVKDLCATGQQLDLRLQQMCFLPYQLGIFKHSDWRYSVGNRAQYISFYNTMWLIANDIIIGLALGSFLIRNNEQVTELIHSEYTLKSVEVMKSQIIWLMGWPAGLKLNNNLDNFMGEMFIWLIYIWTFIIDTYLKPYLPAVIAAIGYSGVFGASMVLSNLSDLFTLLSLHIYVFYSVAARIYNWQLNCLYSLFNLFRGKKYNVLRNRLDSCDYDLDQLLLGTIIFTVLFFLFPTVVVYYVLFCIARVLVICMQVSLKTVLSMLNHFPLFGLMVRLKDPNRLPGGIRIDVLTELSSCSNSTFMSLKNVAIPPSSIFFQYLLLWRKLTSHYVSLYVIRCLLYGEPIKPVPSLQYPMLPDKRPDLLSSWLFLKESFTSYR